MADDSTQRRRWFQNRPRVFLLGGLAVALSLAGWFAISYWEAWQAAKQKAAALAAEEAGYREHRVLVWVFEASDSNAPQTVGFAETRLAPEHSTRLEPMSGVPVEVRFGKVAGAEIVTFPGGVGWVENRLPYELVAESTTIRGSCDLRTPRCDTMWLGGRLRCVSFLIPLGCCATESIAKDLPDQLHGELGELEDLLLACLDRMLRDGSFELIDIREFYSVVGRSKRTDRWRQLLHGGNRERRLLAATALMRVGDPEGTDVLCDACLAAQGNEQVLLVELLPQMPPSEKALETIVALITSPRKRYVLETGSFGGIGDKDRRGSLLDVLTRDYTVAQVLPYKSRLIQWASSSGDAWISDRLTDFFK